MTDLQWQARVDVPGRPRRGSGFLVSRRHILTCEHVVHGVSEVAVTLRDGSAARPATVVTEGPWWSASAAGADIALLELREPVTIETARFAPHSSVEIYRGQPLAAYGYPVNHPELGVTSSEFVTDPHWLIDRNVQVKATEDHSVWIQGGFSGAAAYHRNGTVVGMVKGADPSGARIGTIVPITELARHCPALDDIITLGSLSANAYTDLRLMVSSLRLPPERVLRILASTRAKFGKIPGHLTSLLGLVEALVVEVDHLDDADVRSSLGGLLVHIGTAEARRWVDEYLFDVELPAARTEPAHDGVVLVRLEPSAASAAEAYDLTVWIVTEPDGSLSEPVVTESGLARAQWQDRVEQALVEALSRMPMTVDIDLVTVEFVLPRGHLTEPVELWTDRLDDNTPIGMSKPTVVRDLDWFSRDNPAGLGRRAQVLRDGRRGIGAELRWRDCDDPPGSVLAFKGWLRVGDGPFAVGLTGDWTLADNVATAVAAGPVVMVWQRASCPPGEHEPGVECVGLRFRRELGEGLRAVTFDQVARTVKNLRAEAAYKEDATHCGNNVVLLRDDGRRRPVPLGFAE